MLSGSIKYIHGRVFLKFLITKSSSDQFDLYSFAKMMFLYDYMILLYDCQF